MSTAARSHMRSAGAGQSIEMSEIPVINDITSNAGLRAACARWNDSPVLGLDTEFVRESTYYPIAGLVQVGTADGVWLIDPLTIDDWVPFRNLLENSKLPKVFHAAGEDIELLVRLVGAAPEPLYDTQIGAALAGWGWSLSYQVLVQQRLGIAVEKDHTRSNWLRRPLSDAQRHYAAIDVVWLPTLFQLLYDELAAADRLQWWEEEGRRLVRAAEPVDPALSYRRLNGAWRLRGAQVAALQQLCEWREQQARTTDTPRGWILKDGDCIEIARRLPRNLPQLAAVPELEPAKVRQYGADILVVVAAARESDESEWPASVTGPLPREWGPRLKRMRHLVEQRASELGIAPEILLRKRDCETILRQQTWPAGLGGWREELLGTELLALAREELAS